MVVFDDGRDLVAHDVPRLAQLDVEREDSVHNGKYEDMDLVKEEATESQARSSLRSRTRDSRWGIVGFGKIGLRTVSSRIAQYIHARAYCYHTSSILSFSLSGKSLWSPDSSAL
jgi:lactate dehydrogenase-like 2-hydroxyacid dehydrogenase